MESTSQAKKDLTKTEMFRKFLRDYPTQETNYPIITSMIQTTSTSTEPSVQQFPNTSPTQATSTSTEPSVQQFPNTSPTQATSTSTEPSVQQFPNTSPTQATSTERNIVSEIVEELFGPGDLDQYIDHVNNVDEGIDINILDELKLDLEPFDFQLECIDF